MFDDTDEVFLCTTTQTTPRGKAYIRAQAGSIGGAFIQLRFTTLPREQLPPVREWILNEEYKKGEIVDTSGGAHLHYIALADNNSSNISNRKQPGTPDGVGTWDRFYTVDNPPPAAGGGWRGAWSSSTIFVAGDTCYVDLQGTTRLLLCGFSHHNVNPNSTSSRITSSHIPSANRPWFLL